MTGIEACGSVRSSTARGMSIGVVALKAAPKATKYKEFFGHTPVRSNISSNEALKLSKKVIGPPK